MNPPNFSNSSKPLCKYFEDTIKQNNPEISSGNKSFKIANLRDELLEQRIAKKVQIKEYQNVNLDLTEKVAIELSDLKRKRFIEEKRRQQLRETNQELKDLEMKLRAAYVSKARAVQIAEREAYRRYEKDLQREENEMIEVARIANKEREQMEMEEEHKKKMKFRQDMLNQMDEMKQRKAILYEEFLKEKKIIDEIVQKINEEQLEEMREKLSRKVQFKKDMDEFILVQKLWQEAQKRESEEENRRLMELMKAQDKSAEEKAEMRKKEMKMREDLCERIGNQILEIKNQKLRRQEKLQDLYIAERKALDEEKLREDTENRLRQRIITHLQLQVQRDEMKKRELARQEEDKRYKEELSNDFKKYEENEIVKEKERNERMLHNRQAIKECLEEKKRRRAEEFAIILKTREQDLDDEKRMQEIIEEERIRMLKEHAVNLLGYLPVGVLKESDREHLPLPPRS